MPGSTRLRPEAVEQAAPAWKPSAGEGPGDPV